ITMDAQAMGAFGGDFVLETNDVDESLFRFALSGRAVAPVGEAKVIDNRTPGYTVSGGFTPSQPVNAYGKTQDFAPASPTSQASWTFNNLTPGHYRVSITWSPDVLQAATKAPLTITSGGQMRTILLDQSTLPSQ